jgi:CBS domain containing-hemolysin-like protein
MLGWMPRPVSWLRTIVLIVIATLTVGSLRFFGTYGAYFTYASQHLGFFVAMSLIGLLLPFIGYAYIHSWLIGKKPERWSKKIPSPSSIREAVLSFIVLIFGVIATLIVVMPFVPTNYGYGYSQQIETLSVIATFLWLLITTYMFHGYNLISREYAKKPVDKSKPEAPKTKVDPVDLELNRLKHQTGLMINKPPKKD